MLYDTDDPEDPYPRMFDYLILDEIQELKELLAEIKQEWF